MRAFALVELVVVIVIVIAVSAMVLPNLSKVQADHQLEEQLAILISDLRLAAADSRAGWKDSVYGIKFESDHYIVFRGVNYQVRDLDSDRVVDLPRGLEIVTDLTDDSDELLFNRRGVALQAGTAGFKNQSGQEELALIDGPVIFKQ